MKTVRSARESSWGPFRLAVLAAAGLLWVVELVVVAITVRTGLQVGVVIAGFSMMWFWLRSGTRTGGAKIGRGALVARLRS
jgi:hypothetical protein